MKVLQSQRNHITGVSYYCLHAQSRTENLVTVLYFFDLSLGIRYVVDLTECGVYKVAFYINVSPLHDASSYSYLCQMAEENL